MQELTELKEAIQTLTMEIKVFSETLREQNLRSGKLGEDNENKILKELKKKGVLSKTEIIRILGVSANSAQHIMQRMPKRDKTIIYVPGCGSNSSKLISSEDPLVKKATELLELLPLNQSLSREEIIRELEIGEYDGFGFSFHEVMDTAEMLGCKFRWVETDEIERIGYNGEKIKKKVCRRVG